MEQDQREPVLKREDRWASVRALNLPEVDVVMVVVQEIGIEIVVDVEPLEEEDK